MIRLYIEFDEVSGWNDDVIHWVIGWLYRHGYAFSYEEYEYTGEWKVKVYTKGLELVDMFEFVLGEFGNAIRYFAERYNFGITVAVCLGDECIDVEFEDLKRLEEQKFEEVEERWQKLVESMIYGEDDDPEFEEAIRWERLVGLRNDGDMLDVALEQESYE